MAERLISSACPSPTRSVCPDTSWPRWAGEPAPPSGSCPRYFFKVMEVSSTLLTESRSRRSSRKRTIFLSRSRCGSKSLPRAQQVLGSRSESLLRLPLILLSPSRSAGSAARSFPGTLDQACRREKRDSVHKFKAGCPTRRPVQGAGSRCRPRCRSDLPIVPDSTPASAEGQTSLLVISEVTTLPSDSAPDGPRSGSCSPSVGPTPYTPSGRGRAGSGRPGR